MAEKVLHIATFTGKVFDLLNPKPEMVCIEDIAHSLAYQCRYTGHTKIFYSVAQHCVLMAENPDFPGDPMKKLLHDADETYLGDIAKPWKDLLRVQKGYGVGSRIEGVGKTEQAVQTVIGEALGVDLSFSEDVKESDIRMAATEIRDVMTEMDATFLWGYDLGDEAQERIISWSPEIAEVRFLKTYNNLKKG